MLSIEELRVCYDGFIAVDSASLNVSAGQIVSLIGANGAGKSSLLSAAAGLLKPERGKVTFLGEDLTGMPADQVVNRGLCLVPQGGRCFQRMSVEDNLLVGSYPKTARAGRIRSLERVYTLFPMLKEKRKDPAGTLSGGQRQMAAIGRALMSDPKCLIFDEISLGLAPVVIRDLYATIREINRERQTAILLVEQDTERALRMSDYTYIMQGGRIPLHGKPEELDRESIREAYFGISTPANQSTEQKL